jgi:hypothetical protein
MDQSAARAMDCVGRPFSQEQWPCSTLLMTLWRVAICGLREIRMILDHTRTEHGKLVVLVGFFPAGYTSIRIAVTLGYE